MKVKLSKEEIDMIRQWFNALDDLRGDGYLNKEDYKLGVKITKLSEVYVSDYILEKAGLPIPPKSRTSPW